MYINGKNVFFVDIFDYDDVNYVLIIIWQPNLLSASRNFILKLDVDEVSDLLAGRGEHLTLFLFSDSIEVCRPIIKVFQEV